MGESISHVLVTNPADLSMVISAVGESGRVGLDIETKGLDARTDWPETLRALRAIEVLEQIATLAARDHLKSLAGGAAGRRSPGRRPRQLSAEGGNARPADYVRKWASAQGKDEVCRR